MRRVKATLHSKPQFSGYVKILAKASVSMGVVSDFRHDPEYVARRRQIIRDNHPDRGGSDEALIRALRDLDEHWSRRTSRRAQFEEALPSFVPEDIARQAYERAERYVDILQRGAESIRRHGEKLTNSSELPKNIAHRAGRVAGAARNSVEDIAIRIKRKR